MKNFKKIKVKETKDTLIEITIFPTPVMLFIITIVELISHEKCELSLSLWFLYGIYKLISD